MGIWTANVDRGVKKGINKCNALYNLVFTLTKGWRSKTRFSRIIYHFSTVRRSEPYSGGIGLIKSTIKPFWARWLNETPIFRSLLLLTRKATGGWETVYRRREERASSPDKLLQDNLHEKKKIIYFLDSSPVVLGASLFVFFTWLISARCIHWNNAPQMKYCPAFGLTEILCESAHHKWAKLISNWQYLKNLSTGAYVWPFNGLGEENDFGTDSKTEMEKRWSKLFSKPSTEG